MQIFLSTECDHDEGGNTLDFRGYASDAETSMALKETGVCSHAAAACLKVSSATVAVIKAEIRANVLLKATTPVKASHLDRLGLRDAVLQWALYEDTEEG